MTQQPPTEGTGPPIVDLVKQDLELRKQVGIETYGRPLQANNGRDALQDAYEEALDLACYLKQAIEERQQYVTTEEGTFLRSRNEQLRQRNAAVRQIRYAGLEVDPSLTMGTALHRTILDTLAEAEQRCDPERGLHATPHRGCPLR